MASPLAERYPDLPGTSRFPQPPRSAFEEIRLQRGERYLPRTRHLADDGWARYTNRLFLESSPYLLQHAHNPVNWFPWGDEAFELARALRRPALVSIGYATCHWCHVMEEESFENEEIARLLNENYIAIKVDREERPDIDSVYMSAVHAMGAQGGWPLNVFLTPDRRPFYGGTYFPPFDHSRGIGFQSLLMRLREAYDTDPGRITQAAFQVSAAVRSMLTPATSGGSGTVTLDRAVAPLRERFDAVNGGIAGAPKFPSSLPLRLLMRAYRDQGDTELLQMIWLTLQRMAAGGIHDQVGGGFHRYATDERWLIPHFEKMLYDNSLLAVTYLEGYQLLGDPELAEVARDILRYLRRDLAAPGGGFFAATDADSLAENGRREEGLFFTWTPEELAAALGEERSRVVGLYYGVEEGGNFEGRSILHRARMAAEVADESGLPEEQTRKILEESRELLYQARNRRPQPLMDEKILCSWNGLAISAFAKGGLVLDDPEAVEQARQTAHFILTEMMPEGRLAHSHQGGASRGEAFLDDYAFLIAGLIDLFEVCGEERWLRRALELTAEVRSELEDRDQGGFFLTGSRHETLIASEKPAYDGVIPSGNSVMITNLLRLGELTGDRAFTVVAEQAAQCFASQLSAAPAALSEMLIGLYLMAGQPTEVVIVTPAGRPEAAKPLLDKLRAVFLPNRTLVVVEEGAALVGAARLVPLLQDKSAGDRGMAYVCEDRSCRLPTSDPETFAAELTRVPG
ncbi:thioredoxin domain-containing protein [Geomonas sp. Red32]|uniref:thioredoxin domain-containing protein n=1 Tax=Geomonas sp. Red32 TaxID=2912856 RepID=UPI00202CF86E|nr:thioredoxin domain-containing protein [Geomonas sp. Red32]MCM0082873.1 thioredoxin domain-containing protein [Geomonas sp. Red32]